MGFYLAASLCALLGAKGRGDLLGLDAGGVHHVLPFHVSEFSPSQAKPQVANARSPELDTPGGDRDQMAEKLDPYDVAGLENSLNDSATRVSTIWISYLLFGLYLLVAAGTTNHRQLLLEDSFKLPVLSSDVPLLWFFTLSPVLFVLLHLYVLLQILLLARTAAAYNNAVNLAVKRPGDNAFLRERLANTLFAQVFAGSPREREGWLGRVFRVIAWISLVAAPTYIVFAFQIVFLPYHSHFATWTQRLLVVVEVGAAFVLWPLVLDGRKDFSWRRVRRQLKRAAMLPQRLAKTKRPRRRRLYPACGHAGVLIACMLMVVFSVLCVSFPGEPHANVLTFDYPAAVRCDRWISQRFDHLAGPFVGVVDPDKFKQNQDAARAAGKKPYEGESTRDFHNRDLTCGRFDLANLSGVNFTGARLTGAHLSTVTLEGADLGNAELQMVDISKGQLAGANFKGAQLRGANLSGADLRDASLFAAHLQGADLSVAVMNDADLGGHADLQGVNLIGAQLQGATLSGAFLEGASLQKAKLAGAQLSGAQLMGADLSEAQMQGADFTSADLSGASFRKSWLPGAELNGSFQNQTVFAQTFFWRAVHANCLGASVSAPRFDPVIEPVMSESTVQGVDPGQVEATPENVAAFIDRVSTNVQMKVRLRKSLAEPIDQGALDQMRMSCVENTGNPLTDDLQLAEFIGTRVCQLSSNRKEVAAAIIRNWLNTKEITPLSEYFSSIARRFLACLTDLLQCEFSSY